MFDVNALGPVRVTQEFLPLLRTVPSDTFDSHRPLQLVIPCASQARVGEGPRYRLESRVDGYSDARCQCIESLIQCPKLASVNSCGSEQVTVHIPSASAVKFLRADERHDLGMISDGHRMELLQKFKCCFTVRPRVHPSRSSTSTSSVARLKNGE